MAELQDTLPPGWECKFDTITGKSYFLNHHTKTTTWDDPRLRKVHYQASSKHFSNVSVEHIPLQHGSPVLGRNSVYPSQTSPMPAFQMPPHQSPKRNPLQEMKSFSRMSPLAVRGQRIQDSSLTVVDTDEAVAKISAMFPTVSETHIRLLMKKYHSREALVISALQVEKNPITTPGPFATPPPQRNIHHPAVYGLNHSNTPPLGLRGASSRGGSPILRPASGPNSIYTGSPRIGETIRSSPRPHSSPKLKLRYMKSIFPQAEETVILEILSNNESNIQKTSEILKDMGFQRKDTVKAAQQKLDAKVEEEREKKAKAEQEASSPPPVPKIKTSAEKEALKQRLKEKYKHVADQLITIALESVDFNVNRAGQILDIMVQEDTAAEKKVSDEITEVGEKTVCEADGKLSASVPVSQSRQSIKSLLKSDKIDKDRCYSRVIEENDVDFKSNNIANTNGPNSDLIQGPNDQLLLTDYVEWQGPNKSIWKGSQHLAKGPNRTLLNKRSYQPCGSNPEIRKGPKFGLAKGSIFSQLKSIVVGESRGN